MNAYLPSKTQFRNRLFKEASFEPKGSVNFYSGSLWVPHACMQFFFYCFGRNAFVYMFIFTTPRRYLDQMVCQIFVSSGMAWMTDWKEGGREEERKEKEKRKSL